MSEPRVRFPRPRTTEVVNVDYRDVLEQAVANERFRVLREIRERVEKIATLEGRTYSETNRHARDYKVDVLAALNAIEAEGKE